MDITIDELYAELVEDKEDAAKDSGFTAEDIEGKLLMSVPEHLRHLSELQFYHNAVQLRADVIELCYSNAIPKSLRGAFSVPMCNTAKEIVDLLLEGERFYPNTQENVYKRKECYGKALARIDSLCSDMQTLAAHQTKYQISKVKIAKMCHIAEQCKEETKLLNTVRKNVKLKK